MRYVVTIGVASAVLLALAAGCGGGEGAPAEGAATGTLGKDAPKGDMGSVIGEAASAANQKLADTFSSQVQQQQSQLDTLKASATQFADQKLDGLLSQLDTELKSATAKVNELKSAGQDKAKAIQQDLGDIMAQVTDLVDQAKARVAELAKGG